MSWFNNKTKSQTTVGSTIAPQNKEKQLKAPEEKSEEAKQAAAWTADTSATTGGLVIEESLNSVSENAAMFFANGQYDQAQSTLTQHLNETRGDTEKLIWYLLLDLYQVQRNKAQFEKLAELFAKKFSVSPPSWGDAVTSTETQFSGRNVMVLDGALDKDIEDKAKDFLRVTKEQKVCKIECSRVSLAQSTEEGLKIWLEAMYRVRKVKAKATLMGESGVIESLKEIVELAKTSRSVDKQVYWLLLLELWQWQGKEAEFEDSAFEFAVAYDLSPPGFDVAGVMKGETDVKEVKKTPPSPPLIMTEGATNEWLDKLTKWLEDNDDGQYAEIKFSHVERLAFEAAGVWSSWAHKDLQRAKRLRLGQPNHWILVLMNMVNLSTHIKAVSRKAA